MMAKAISIPLAAAALIVGIGCADAPERGAAIAAADPGEAHIARLESIFWTCDYVATTRGIDATPMRQCAAATRELRQVKFGGNFHRMLAWWQENKQTEHGKRRIERNDPEL